MIQILINQLKNKKLIQNIILQTISPFEKLYNQSITVLRLDQLHPQISGNKWFKLQYFLNAFSHSKKEKLATFGGAFSNHIAATATACQLLEIPCIGVIRGEESDTLSHTLSFAKSCGMELQFVSRNEYKNKDSIIDAHPSYFWIPEGGYGILGADGAETIWQCIPDCGTYTHIFLPIGSGTTTAGLLKGCHKNQYIEGISVMKNNFSLENEIYTLVEDSEKMKHLHLHHEYHFGGYAKKNSELITFMNQIWEKYRLPLDFVYTGKAFYAMLDLLNKGDISADGKILFIHTGGLQGNLSLPTGTLVY